MRFEIHQPCIALQPYVKHLVISENDADSIYNIIPGTNPVAGFQYKGRLSYQASGSFTDLSAAGITGLLSAARTFRNVEETGSILVVFQETGASQFFRTPLNYLYKESVSLEHIFSATDIRNVEEALENAHTDQSRIKVVEKFLLSQLSPAKPDRMVKTAIEWIRKSQGTIRINHLAAMLNTSASPLEKRFRQIAGCSPKKFASIVRFQSVIIALENDNTATAEYLLGFYDQAHFIKDFKRYTYLTPEQYLKALRQTNSIK